MAKRAKGLVDVNVEGLEDVLDQMRRCGLAVDDVIYFAAEDGAEIIANEVQKRAPKNGIIAIELKKTTLRQANVSIGVDKKQGYYQILETGAQPHEIKPEKKKAMSFRDPFLSRLSGGDETAVVTSVNHPGMAARPFMRPGIEAGKDQAIAAMGQRWAKALNDVAAKAKGPS